MAQISTIQKSDINQAGRFDAEYFKPEYLEVENKLNSLNCNKLNQYCNFIKKGIFDISPKYYKKEGVPLIRTSEIKYPYIDFSTTVFLGEKTHKLNNKTELKAGDLIFTKIGAYIGDVSILPPLFKKYNFSQNVAGLSIKKDRINPYFLLAFLLSKYSKEQIFRITMLSGQGKLELKDIKNIKIPVFSQPFQISIEKIVRESYAKQAESKTLYQQAEQLLLTELGLVDFKLKHQPTFSTTKGEVEQAERFDAEYFQPKYKQIINRIENYSGGFKLVKNMLNWQKGVEVGSEAYSESGKDFVRVSDVSINGVEQTNRKISAELFTELKANFQPKQKDILFTKDGTIGISYLLKEDIQGVLSSAFLRLTLKQAYQNFKKECLTLILNSIVCKLQIEQLSGGAVIAHLKPSDFEKFKIPLIKPDIQNQIAQKITLSHQLRKQSKDLLEQAKKSVEQEIENQANQY